MTKPKAVYAGSFDPITRGHLSVILRASKVFDVVVAVGNNPAKTTLFSLDERKALVAGALEERKIKAEVQSFEGLLLKFCKTNNIEVILRGLRSATDFDYELNLAQINKSQYAYNVETYFLPTNPETSFISSSAVRELAKLDAEIEEYVTMNVYKALFDRYKEIKKNDEIRARLGNVNNPGGKLG